MQFITFLFTISTASVMASSGAEGPSLGTSQASNGSNATSLSSLSILSSNVTTDNAFIIKCDGGQYGRDLSIADCKDAKDYIPSGSDQYAWLERHIAFGGAHFALPYRYMGGRYRSLRSPRVVFYLFVTDRGRCYIELSLAAGYSISYASLYEVQSAAKAIMLKCRTGGTLQGGSLSNIGKPIHSSGLAAMLKAQCWMSRS